MCLFMSACFIVRFIVSIVIIIIIIIIIISIIIMIIVISSSSSNSISCLGIFVEMEFLAPIAAR